MLRKAKFPLTLLFRLFGTPNKKTPGHEFAGVVELVGDDVTRFKVGDQVFGTTTGLKIGANAEFVCVPESWSKGVLAVKPGNLSFEEAAAVPVGGMTALYILKKGDVQPGQKVLINGASGSVGSFALQIAQHLGAEVTGVTSTANVEMVKSLGADKVIDYKREDFTESGERYDVVFDAVGKTSASQCEKVLKENGRFLTVQSSTSEEMANFIYLREMIKTGKLRPYIDRTYSLAETAEAHRYVETGRKTGNVVVII
jgi:NADPH:quinone reductase-like Zn-dependent oxidoreductase